MDNIDEQTAERERHSRIYRSTHYPSDVANLPSVPFYAVFVNKVHNYADPYEDTNPTRSWSKTISDPYLELITFDTDEALEDWIIKAEKYLQYKVVRINPVKVQTKISVDLME